MRLFLVLCCSLAAVTHAKPQGYNYGTGIPGGSATGSHHQSGGSFAGGLSGLGGFGAPIGGGGVGAGGSNYAGFGSGSNGPSFGGFPSSTTSGAGQSAGGFSGSGVGGVGGGFSGFGGGGALGAYEAQQQQQSGGFEAPLVHKQFITVSAPEDHDTLEQSKHFVIGRPQKNYRVVFIKAPSSGSANVKLSAEYAPKEEKTVIYVLSKKDSALEINDIATPAPTVPEKPEVFFIKYKTEDEAHHAQQQIQAEYDKIEGTSEHSDGGIGQQQSVVGILDGGAGAAGGHGDGISSGISGGFGGIAGGVGGSSYNSGSSGGLVGATSSYQSGSSGAKSPTYLPPSRVV